MKQILLLLLFPVSVFAQQEFRVYFDFNSTVPNAVSLARFNDWASKNTDAEILQLSGHADSVDISNYNKALSMRRIQSVLKLLQEKDIAISESVRLDPLGEDFKQSKDQSENRRVTFSYRQKQKPNAASGPKEETVVEDPTLPADELNTGALSSRVKNLFKFAKKGDLIRINNIHFYLNSEKVIPASEPVMQDLYQTLVDNPGLRIEIHGHICCNPNIYDTRLSFRRAKFIFAYLLKKGIPLNRLGYKGFGSAQPIYGIPERSMREEQANRRVEILIVETQLRQ